MDDSSHSSAGPYYPDVVELTGGRDWRTALGWAHRGRQGGLCGRGV